MKRIKSKILTISILFSILIIGLFPLNSIAIDDLSFTFDDNILFDSDILEYDQSFNLRKQQEYTEIYNATYSFTKDNISSIPLNWSADIGTDTSAQVISNILGHSKVFEIYDGSGSTHINVNTTFSSTSGTYEFWFMTNDTTESTFLYGNNEGNAVSIRIYVSADNFYVNPGGAGASIVIGVSDNSWNHLRIDFECGGGGYEGLGPDTFYWYINGIQYGAYAMETVANRLDNFELFTLDASTNDYYTYLDAFGFNWDRTMEIDNFNDDTIGENPLHWNDNDGLGGSTESSIDDFSFPPEIIMTLFDYNTSAKANTSRDFPLSINIVEWTMAITSFDTTLGFFTLRENGIFILSVRFSNENIFCTNGFDSFTISNSNIIDIFSLFKIELFYDTDSYNIYLNGSLLATNLNFLVNVSNHITTLELATSIFPEGYNFYVDNITFIQKYYINDNFLPYIDISQTLQEVDKYEFALGSTNTLQTIGSSSYGTWIESDSGGHDKVKIKEHPTDSNNRVVEISTNNPGDVKGLSKTNFSLTDNFIEINLKFELFVMTGNTSYHLITIQTSAFTIITGFIMWHNGTLGWFPDISSGGISLRDDLTTGKVYNLQVLLNYELDIFILDWYIDGLFNESYIRPLMLGGQSGLREIHIASHWDDDPARMELYSVGVYENGLTDSKEIGWNVVDLQVSDWNPQTYNLFSILGNGVMTLGIISGSYSVGENFTGFNNSVNLDNTLITLNFFNLPFFNLTNPSIVFSIKGKNFSTSHLKIDGVKLLESSNEYPLIFKSQGVNINEGYFYVSGNRLRFFHFSDDSNLEYIQERFNINDISSEGFLTSFRSNIDNNAKGFFRINYTSTSNIIQLPIIPTTTRFILTQNKTIRDLVILITDNDINSISGLTEGFIHLIKLQQVENLLISVITTSLITMMIPILIILVPTLAISQSYGKNLIIPMFIFISLILTITGIIPIWLFFVIAISSSVFILKMKEGLI